MEGGLAGGRQKWAPTDQQRRAARRYARLGIPDTAISRFLRIDRKTLRHSALGAELADVRLALRARLMAPYLKDALEEYGGDRSARMLLGLLSRADDAAADEPSGDTETEQSEQEKASK